MKKLTLLIFLLISIITFGQIKPEMILVEGGTFNMGNPYTDERKGDADETPVHKVTVSNFYIGKFEVTVKEYKEFLKDNYTEFDRFGVRHSLSPMPDSVWWQGHPDCYKFWQGQITKWWGYKDDYPIFNITWYEAVAYCNWLSVKTGLEKCYSINADGGVDVDIKKNGYRLPTEAEWEYAAKGGKQSKNYLYSGSNNVLEVGWIDDNTFMQGPKEVGKLKPNELGIYDMTGNVWEWCSDYYSPYFYNNSPQFNPINNSSTSYRSLRGCGWHFHNKYAPLYTRDGPKPGFTDYTYGFRLVRNAK